MIDVPELFAEMAKLNYINLVPTNKKVYNSSDELRAVVDPLAREQGVLVANCGVSINIAKIGRMHRRHPEIDFAVILGNCYSYQIGLRTEAEWGIMFNAINNRPNFPFRATKPEGLGGLGLTLIKRLR